MRKGKTAHLSIPQATGRSAAGGSSRPLDHWLVRRMLAWMHEPPVVVRLWDGTEIRPSTPAPEATMEIRDRGALLALVLNPDLNFGDLYSAGRIEIHGDLTGFLVEVYRRLDDGGTGPLLRAARAWINRPRRNNLSDSRDNIHHHYDIGNDFYRLWLDGEHIQYTCAYYPDASLTLEQAQAAKMDHVCRKLRLRPGDTVVEAGCGWGGLARFMARHYGVRVRAYNISREQVAFARDRAAQEGLGDRVEYVQEDYRNIEGHYDAFVSVGMLEHVGTPQYRELGEVIRRSLGRDGRGLIHTIGRNRPKPLNAWIEKRIFPGAYPPTLRQMMDIFENTPFSVLDVENLRLHYARTLRHWRERFEQHRERVSEMFDEQFVRAWRLYLHGSEAAFSAGELQLFQVVFAHHDNNDIPGSRAHLYDGRMPP
jgi:cyclopropane-fatty-acyl-phospholipid synthase